MNREQIKFMIVAGEASGDLHAAKLVRALSEAVPDGPVEFFGSAGPKMREAGVRATVKSDDLSIVGIVEIARKLPMFMRALKTLKRAARKERPTAVILVDFPDFNLRLARSMKRLGLPVVYYIPPQLWAWRKHRVEIIRKYVDLVLTVLPFEKDWFVGEGVAKVEYVGSPLSREVHTSVSREGFRRKYDLEPEAPVIALLPGSRHKEIVRILPVMLDSASIIEAKHPSSQFIIAVASAEDETDVKRVIQRSQSNGRALPKRLRTLLGQTYDVVNAADAAAITSGTATLEAALLGTPMVVVYKTSSLNYSLLRPLISVEHFGLVNLIAGERIARELIQDEFTSQGLAAELERLMNTAVNTEMRVKLRSVADKLGHGGASKRAAEVILKYLGVRA